MIALVQATRIILVALVLPFLIWSVTRVAPHRTVAAFVPLASLRANEVLWFSVAVLLGVPTGILLRLPARYLLGAMSASAIMHLMGLTQFELPTAARATAQVVIGATIGCRFAFAPPRRITGVIGLSFGSTILLLSVTLAFASVLLPHRRPVRLSRARLLTGRCRRDKRRCSVPWRGGPVRCSPPYRPSLSDSSGSGCSATDFLIGTAGRRFPTIGSSLLWNIGEALLSAAWVC